MICLSAVRPPFLSSMRVSHQYLALAVRVFGVRRKVCSVDSCGVRLLVVRIPVYLCACECLSSSLCLVRCPRSLCLSI